MDKEKQIEEMACTMCGNKNICVGEGVEKCILYPEMRRYADRAYREDYRKQKRGEWVWEKQRLYEIPSLLLLWKSRRLGTQILLRLRREDGRWGGCHRHKCRPQIRVDQRGGEVAGNWTKCFGLLIEVLPRC